MNVSEIGSGSGTQNTATTRTPSDELSKDDFLKLMIAQLKNQNPLSPTDSTDFVTQTAQMTSLEQLQNLNSNFSQLLTLFQDNSSENGMLLAVSLLGKTVTATDPESGATYSGTASGYQLLNNLLLMTVGDSQVPLSWIDSGAVGQ